jgi:adenylate kinase
MKIVLTGQVGLDKKPFAETMARMARGQGFECAVCNIGQMMYAEAPDVAPGRILDLPLGRLQSLRRAVFKDVLATCRSKPNVIINTHATFRWRHGLFCAFDFDQMKQLDADLYVTLVDNVDRVHWRLLRDGHANHTLKDIMVWREEEILATELLSQVVAGHGRFYISARGEGEATPESIVRLGLRPEMRKVYLSFPMSHVMDQPDLLGQIADFRKQMKQHFVCFDPGDLEEKVLCQQALEAASQGQRTLQVSIEGQNLPLETAQVVDIIPDIDGQIYSRDFKLIDQSDMIVSLVPELPSGKPGLSSGVERELQHAHEATREAFVIWLPSCPPSPFVSETATKVFGSLGEALDYFDDAGYIPRPPSGTLFAQ